MAGAWPAGIPAAGSCCPCQRLGINHLEHRLEKPADHTTGTFKPAINEHGPEDRLHGVGKDRGAPEAAAFHLPFPQAQKVAQAQPLGDLGEGLLLDQVGAQAREVPLVEARVLEEEQLRDHAVEHRIAKEFQPFVVHAAMRAVRDRLLQQFTAVEGVLEPLFERAQVPVGTLRAVHALLVSWRQTGIHWPGRPGWSRLDPAKSITMRTLSITGIEKE